MSRRGESPVEIALLALLLAEFFPEVDATSELIGEWAGCNPVIVRRIYGKLKRAGLLDTGPGRRSLELARDARSISLLEIVEAITPLDRAGVFGVEPSLVIMLLFQSSSIPGRPLASRGSFCRTSR